VALLLLCSAGHATAAEVRRAIGGQQQSGVVAPAAFAALDAVVDALLFNARTITAALHMRRNQPRAQRAALRIRNSQLHVWCACVCVCVFFGFVQPSAV